MSRFLQDNWDKILTLLIGGIVGYFSGQIATHKEIAAISAKVAVFESNARTTYDPAARKLEEINLTLIGLEQNLSGLRNQQDLTDKLVELHLEKFQIELEKVRSDTLKVLTEFLQESKT